MFNRIPLELQALPQWVTWKYVIVPTEDGERTTKVPYNPSAGKKASVTDPYAWSTFAAVCKAVADGHYDGIGFVFTEGDDYAGIDLDVKEGTAPTEFQQSIVGQLDTYAELSPSGRGLHLICKASLVAGTNNQRLGVEMYSEGRFFTMTGNVTIDKPIGERHSVANKIWDKVFTKDVATLGPLDIQTPTPSQSDQELINRLCRVQINAGYYNYETVRNWSDAYYSVLGGLCHLSSDEQQIKRIILNSPLVLRAPDHSSGPRVQRVERLWANEYHDAAAKGDSERRDRPFRVWSMQWFPGGTREQYNEVIERTKQSAALIIENRLAAQAAEQEAHNDHVISSARALIEEEQGKPIKPTVKVNLELPYVTDVDAELTPPPGAMGTFIQAVHDGTFTPVMEYAVAICLAYVSGITSRGYMHGYEGGNAMFVIGGQSATGKSSVISTLRRMIDQVPTEGNLAQPPSSSIISDKTKSVQGIHTKFTENPACAWIVDEAHSMLNALNDPRSNSDHEVKDAINQLYDCGAPGSRYSIPLSRNGKESNYLPIPDLSVGIAWFTTTDKLRSCLSDAEAQDGFLSRFIPIVYRGAMGEDNHNQLRELPTDIVNRLAFIYRVTREANSTIAQYPMEYAGRIAKVGITPEAQDMLLQFGTASRDLCRRAQAGRVPEEYIAISRASASAVRIARALAVMENPKAPVIDAVGLQWSIQYVTSRLVQIITMLQNGELGSGAAIEVSTILNTLRKYSTSDEPYVKSSVLMNRLRRLAPFKSERGASVSRWIKTTLVSMIEDGLIEAIEVKPEGAGRPALAYALVKTG